jgi:outer membrane protein OmpA-like peptidoglycan-associated protein
MRKFIAIPALLAVAVALSACATKPNPNLEQAKQNFSSLQADPRASQMAALETKDAKSMLDKSDLAFREGEDQAKIDQMAYLTNQRVELAKQTIALKTAEKDFRATSSQRAQTRLEARDAEIRNLQSKLNAKQTDRGSVVTFGDVLFDVNKAELKPSASSEVRGLADFLSQNPERKVLIEGFTDNTGSDSLNLDLSQRRADAVRSALVRQGVDISRITTQGFGKAHPVADNSSAASRAMNRRVEVTISNDSASVAPRR